eukprot:GHVU01209472.1.p1 GENE.GHVU01209472.1~~GHVU01209472.1.p1  ORF type:complete len:534 (+),score=138.40 GHVU01209472.1:160-1761(+)
MSVNVLNPHADVLKGSGALSANLTAAVGLQSVMKSNLGPRGTLKMLVGGAGQIKITKDGNVLLHEMQIQHPTASMIARASTAQDEITGDGTTSTVLIAAELIKQAAMYIDEGVHARQLVEGIQLAKVEVCEVLEKMKHSVDVTDRAILTSVAQTSLRTKLQRSMADQMTDVVVGAVECIHQADTAIDLFMVEILHMKHRLSTDTRLVRGMVMDHGCRHPDMPKKLSKCFILTINVSLEYEKSEVNSSFFYSNAEDRERLVIAERKFTDDKVIKILELKKKVCDGTDYSFVVLNQKGIDPASLDMMAKENIMALRRVKRRNMERLTLCCGGNAINCVDDLKPEDLGWAEEVHEELLGEDKFTFVEGVKNPKACTILIKGPTDHHIAQIKDAIRDGLRAVRNTIEDGCVIPGGGAFEIAANKHLEKYKASVTGKKKLGVEVFATALLVIPKALIKNSGFDQQDVLLEVMDAYEKTGRPTGVDVYAGTPLSPVAEGIWDNYRVKKQLLTLAPTLAEQLLLVDEIIKAGKQMGGNKN